MFLASCEDFLGDLTYIRIWHDNSGKSPAWYMSKVAVHDLNTNKKYLFINEAWLAVEEGKASWNLFLERRTKIRGYCHTRISF